MTIVDTGRRLLARVGVPLLRLSLGLVFVWFGALKVADRTPVGDLVAGTVPWLDPGWFVPALGAFEVVLGIALIVGYRLGWVALLMAAHLAGTFLTLVVQPDVAFQQEFVRVVTLSRRCRSISEQPVDIEAPVFLIHHVDYRSVDE